MSGEPLLDARVPGDRLRRRSAGPAAIFLQDFFAHLFLFGPLRRIADNDSMIKWRKPRKSNRGWKASTTEVTSAKLEPNWKPELNKSVTASTDVATIRDPNQNVFVTPQLVRRGL